MSAAQARAAEDRAHLVTFLGNNLTSYCVSVPFVRNGFRDLELGCRGVEPSGHRITFGAAPDFKEKMKNCGAGLPWGSHTLHPSLLYGSISSAFSRVRSKMAAMRHAWLQPAHPLEQFLDSLGSENMHDHDPEEMSLAEWPAACMVSIFNREFSNEGLCACLIYCIVINNISNRDTHINPQPPYNSDIPKISKHELKTRS